MSVGETKGREVEELVKRRKPKMVLELGAYVGYSGIEFARVGKGSNGRDESTRLMVDVVCS